MLPLPIFFASAGIVLTAYVGYVIIKSWINRWKQHNAPKSLASKDNLPQPASIYMTLDQGKDLAPIVIRFSQNNLKPKPKKQQTPIDEFNKLTQKLDENIKEIQDTQQGIRLGIEECQTIHESNKCLLEEIKTKITEANTSLSP